jgi:hypothetical protein
MATASKRQLDTSVEKTGPAGYEYQYLVTTWLILLLWKSGLEAGFVEGGREDTILNLRTQEGPYHLEVQIKSEKGGITVRRLASWLMHFPNRSAKDSLLEWLQKSEQRGIAFVTAGRVEGELTGLLSRDRQSEFLKPREQPAILRPQAKALREALRNCCTKLSTPLGRARREYCVILAKKLRLDELKRISRRFFVLEQMSPKTVADETSHLLNDRFRVPQSEAGKVRDALVALIPRAREEGLDLVSLFGQVLQDYCRPRIFSQPVYVDRGDEPELVTELRNEVALLLTGPMRCGKTHTGRYVAQKFQDEGFDWRETEDPDEAKRFLLDLSTPEDRLALLEDPFGKITLNGDAYERWETVGSLIAGLRPNRKLIVSCRRDILQSLAKDREPKLEGKIWRDLALTNTAMAVEIWRSHASAQHSGVIEAVAEGLSRMEPAHLLQPGQISFLARRQPDSLVGLSLEQLLQVARYDARVIGQKLVFQGITMRETLATLALSATTLNRVSLEDLAFILGSSEILPGKIEREFGRAYGGPESPAPQFPVYSSLGTLAPGYRDALDELEARGLVEQSGGYRFSHPIYEQASLESLRSMPTFQFKRAIQLTRRAMFSLSSSTARTSVEILHRLRREESNVDRFRELTELGFEAFFSIFPVVRDTSMKRLVEDFEVLDVRLRKSLLKVVQSQWGEHKDILWHQGEPWFDTRESIPFSSFFDPSVTPQAVALAAKDLQSLGPSERLPAEQMWTILKSYKSRGLSDMAILEKALIYDEALIRGEAAFFLFRDHGSGPQALLEQIVRDPNPMIVIEAVRGLLKGWEGHDEAACNSAREVILAALEHPSRAILGIRFLTNFEEETGRYDGAAPWKLWARIAPPVLRGLPRHSHVNEGRLYRMFTMAIPSLDTAEALEILKIWIDWIEDSLAVRLPEDYGLGVAELLLRITGQDAEARREFIPRLLAQTDTSFRVTVVSDLINGWKNLDDREQKLLFRSLEESRVDQRWAQAAALTIADPPWDIVEFLLGDAATLLLPEEAILERVPLKVLDACLSMHTGHPQPLGWIGLHHRAAEPWDSLLLWIARDPRHGLFDLGIRELLTRFSEEEQSSVSLKIWIKLSRNADAATCDRLFEHLLRWTARQVARSMDSPLQSYWDALVRSPGAELLIRSWYETIFEALRDIESHHNLDLVFRLPGFSEAFVNRFPEDLAVLKLVNQPLTDTVRQGIAEQYERNPPKLLRVHDEVLAVLEGKRDSSDPLVQKVFQARHEWCDRTDRDNDPWNDHYELEDWVWASRPA